MLTLDKKFLWGQDVFEIKGKSTDEKPLDAPNASTFYEMDTGDLYMFDAEAKAWLKQ